MTDQELKKLSRKDLLELLVSQGRELERLQADLDQSRAALEDRKIQLQEAGSIADAALQLNKVFESAQEAAQQYLDNIRQRNEEVEAACTRREAESQEKADRLLREAESKARELEETAQREAEQRVGQAEAEAQRLETETRDKCQAMEKEAQERSDAYWAEVSRRIEAFFKEHEELKSLLASGGRK